ncbi:MAG TPA: hypothetical protein VEL82_06640 [Thermoplasmata archaeon]|nr:hypothetical protein [Thermoplasmata archaeon]
MAKKARRKLEEEEEEAFEFPVFDEAAFARKEFELGTGLILAGLLTVILGVLGWILTASGLPWFAPLVVGLAVIAASPFLIGRLRTLSSQFTKGDWAGLIVLEFFGFLALWFLLLNIAPRAI